jgi:cyclopropane fatty-acyl-phospholipid synthase-like methyltransferase
MTTFDDKPFSPACEENKVPILAVIGPLFEDCHTVLEIGSGTGQHAVYFAGHLPWLRWQTSDQPAHLPGIRLWLAAARLDNLPEPVALDVTGTWPEGPFDAVFSANTAHIMSLPEVAAMIRGVGQVLAPGGRFALYGPFSRGGRHTSDSNRDFDHWLRMRDPDSGVRDIDTLEPLAAEAGLILEADHTMPVNNRTLIWRRTETR